jgi:hypothetical protein
MIHTYNMSCPAQYVYFDIFDNVRLMKQLLLFMDFNSRHRKKFSFILNASVLLISL